MKSWGRLLCIVSLLCLVGCSVNMSTKRYTLSGPALARVPAASKTSQTLLVSPVIAAPGFQTSRMIYTKQPHVLSSFVHHRWVAPPANMLASLCTQALRQSGYFRAVVQPPFSGTSQWQLDINLVAIEQDFLGNDMSRVRLVMDAQLLSHHTHRIVASRRFQVSLSAAPTPYDGVVALNRAAASMSRQLVSFITAHAHS